MDGTGEKTSAEIEPAKDRPATAVIVQISSQISSRRTYPRIQSVLGFGAVWILWSSQTISRDG